MDAKAPKKQREAPHADDCDFTQRKQKSDGSDTVLQTQGRKEEGRRVVGGQPSLFYSS